MMFRIKLITSHLPGSSFAITMLTAFMMAATNTAVQAEFQAGDVVPAFSLEATDGLSFSLARREGNVFLNHGGKSLKPRIVIMHLFQPDCLQCRAQMKALEALYQEFHKSRVMVIGVGHRGDIQQVRAVARQLGVTFPLLMGTGSPLANQFARGDTLGIADSRGVVRFAQVGYGKGDEKTWQESVKLLLAGKPVREPTIARNRLRIGDELPAIRLNSLITGKPMALTGEGGRLTFHDETGRILHPKAALGFFSRL